MAGNKLQKQLMGIGVSRNDAAAFIRGYRAIQRSGNRFLCQDIMCGPRPVPTFQGYTLRKLTASAEIPNFMFCDNVDELAEGRVRRELAMKMGDALLDSGCVTSFQYALPRDSTVFRATVHVVVPGVEK